ncbi:MAG TPA: N-formylglutamate amidohydrolase [Desulfuromonadales bacterium]|nr:N-formylglutamate amidohydrolase [Desulfuromonadales bacterium]
MAETYRIILSCEHGGRRIPAPYRPLFAGQDELLATHRGYDIGILPFARFLARELEAPLHAAEVSRLLVDLNRSRRSPTLFSEVTRQLPADEREAILRRYYDSYREAVTQSVAAGLRNGGVLHLSVHSFTPELRGVVRRADIGLLYAPTQPAEAEFCRRWQATVACLDPALRVRRNYPYRGVSDCLVTTLRRQFAGERYLGVEIEVNQKLPLGEPGRWRHVQRVLLDSLRAILAPT